MLNRRQALTRATALASLAVGGGALSGAARAQVSPAVVQLSEQRNRFLLDVAVDASSGYRFVLDTGATAHFISTRLVEALRLPQVGDRLVRGYDGRNRDKVVGLNRLSVGGIELGRSRAIAWAPERLEQHDGLIGYPLLFPRAVIALGEARISLGGGPDAELRLTAVGAEVSRSQTMLVGGVPGAQGRFVLDTGSQAFTISPAFHERIRQTDDYKASVQLVYRNADGAARTAAFRPAQMRFGDFTLDAPVVRVGQADGGEGAFYGVDGLFGVGLLRRYTWALDQVAGTLQVGGEAASKLGYDGLGLRLGHRDGVVRVLEVADDGPAFDARVRPGDEVRRQRRTAGGSMLTLGGDREVELLARALL